MQKLVHHKQGHNDALNASEILLRNANLFDNGFEDLYYAARIGVATYIGCRNYLLSAIIAIVDYTFVVTLRSYHFWPEYHYQIMKAQEHAENFDFYMKILLHYYA